MITECTPSQLEFGFHGRRRVTACFDGGRLTTEGGGLLLGATDARIGLMSRLASCFGDHRDPSAVEHTVQDLVSQRVYGLALGYENLNDHNQLRLDAFMALLVGKSDITGANRRRARDKRRPLASASGLNRLELSLPEEASGDRYKRIPADGAALDRLLVDLFLEAHDEAPAEIVLDLDATDDPLPREQEGRFFHGYYRCYCYMLLYAFCGEHLLLARLQRSNHDANAGTIRELAPIVARIREAWPATRIVLRGDSGFCRERTMAWCEREGLFYVFGVARICALRGGSRSRGADFMRPKRPRGGSGSSATGPAPPGPARGEWWARRNGSKRALILASSSPICREAEPASRHSTSSSTAPAETWKTASRSSSSTSSPTAPPPPPWPPINSASTSPLSPTFCSPPSVGSLSRTPARPASSAAPCASASSKSPPEYASPTAASGSTCQTPSPGRTTSPKPSQTSNEDPSATRRPETRRETRHHNTPPRIDSTKECARRPP